MRYPETTTFETDCKKGVRACNRPECPVCNPPTQTTELLPDVIKFLLGEDELDGCWFGQTKPVNAIGEFWWRKYLREAWRNK